MVMRLSVITSKTGNNAFFVFLGHFWAYFGQSHNRIGWATSMPFTSINSIKAKSNPWNFRQKYWELVELENDIMYSFLFLVTGFFKSFFINAKTKLSYEVQQKYILTVGGTYQHPTKFLQVSLKPDCKNLGSGVPT